MNTKDKARELVDEFANTNSINIAFLNAFEYIKEKKRAKQCALIAVDRIMKSGCTQPSGVLLIMEIMKKLLSIGKK